MPETVLEEVETVGTTVLVVKVVELDDIITALDDAGVEVDVRAELVLLDTLRLLLRAVELEDNKTALVDVSVEVEEGELRLLLSVDELEDVTTTLGASVDVDEGAVLATLDELKLLLSAYRVSPLPPPHVSAELPPQGMLHLPSVVAELPDVRVLPQKHSVAYSTPKY